MVHPDKPTTSYLVEGPGLATYYGLPAHDVYLAGSPILQCGTCPDVTTFLFGRESSPAYKASEQPAPISSLPNAEGNYDNKFLRGAFPAGSNGIAEFQTIFPGYTSEGANHINVMVHTSSSASSGVSHTGQVFFTDKWTTIIGMQPPYNTNANLRVTNLDDPVYAAANKAGFYPVVE
ncbi:hypothetical protein DXG01_009743 [Tephrocybe rancida]|nr:hypothetical protein DXG01_009743 [Tephrocybe rancida]